MLPGLIGFDVGIPRARMSVALIEIQHALNARWSGITALSYGHVADGNLHLVVHLPDSSSESDDEIHQLVYEIVQSHAGAISAEHGVGQSKKPWLQMSRTSQELLLMKTIKQAIDPKAILNPGRIFG